MTHVPARRLAGKIIHVTGAAGGIGHAVMARIRAEGGIAVGSDLAAGEGVELALDVTDEAAWAHATDRLAQRYGAIDGLVNAAGVVMLGSVAETSYAAWKRVLAINLDGVFLGCRAMLPLMAARGGSIVNLSSVSGIVGGHNLAAYNAAKGGVRMLTKSVALHGARLKPPVRCNSVHPAFVEGPMVDGMLASVRDPARAAAKMQADIPLQRFGKADEVAAMVAYLLSDEAAFCTGGAYLIDGGLTA
ncbi:MAG: SDR family NAD(P)-dependent oxidoreductase [Beijerinckiaceae bacterium]